MDEKSKMIVMEEVNYLSIIADILAIVSLLLAMYFYYASRTKEIQELKNIVENKSKDEMDNLSKELSEIKSDIKHLNKETFDLVKKQFSFMQQQVGKVGTKSAIKPDVEILNTIMEHKVITVETLCMQFNNLDKFIIIKYVEQFSERGTLTFDGSVIKLNENKDKKEEES